MIHASPIDLISGGQMKASLSPDQVLFSVTLQKNQINFIAFKALSLAKTSRC